MTEIISSSLLHPTAALLIIGNEILSGRTVDSNSSFLTKELYKIGITVEEIRVVQDKLDTIRDSVNALRNLYNYVFTTGGLGPTHDDVTAEAISLAFDLPFEEHKEASALLLERYGDQYTPARKRMSMMPKNAALIRNPASGAPGFCVDNVFVLPGVPDIMQSMFHVLSPKLSHGAPLYTDSVIFHVGESVIADDLRNFQNNMLCVEIGSYPFFKSGLIGTCIVIRSRDQEALNKAIHELSKTLQAYLPQ